MTPQEFGREVRAAREERGGDDAPSIREMIREKFPDMSNVEYNNLVFVASDKGLI